MLARNRLRLRIQNAETHKKKIDWQGKLEAAGLGEERLLREINRRLKAKVTKYWQGVSLGDHVDNATRQRATELLAELLGKKKLELSLNTELPQIVMQYPHDPRLDGQDGK